MPTINRNLIRFSGNQHGVVFGSYAERMVNVIKTIFKPYATIATEHSYKLNRLFRGSSFKAIIRNLPTGLVLNLLAIVQGETIAVVELTNRTNVNYVCYLFPFLYEYIIAYKL